MDRSPSRLRNAGGVVTSAILSPGVPNQRFGDTRPTNTSASSADHSREQVQLALDGLLGDDENAPSTRPYSIGPSVEITRSPARRSRSQIAPEPITHGLGASQSGRSSSRLLAQGGQLSPGSPNAAQRASGTIPIDGYSPTAGAGRRRRSSIRSPKAYSLGITQGIEISTLEGLQVYLDEKQREVANAHARRTKELEAVLAKEKNYFDALLDNDLEKAGVQLKATSALLKGQGSWSNANFRRGSRQISNEGGNSAMNDKNNDQIKQADHLRKKLKAHHDEARTVLAKKLQVENARMGRVIKTNLGKYANPKLAQGAKAAILASITEYLDGEEFVRIVTAPLNYRNPDFIGSMEQELGIIGMDYNPTTMQERRTSAFGGTDYDSKMEQLEEKKVREQQQRMAGDALRQREKLQRESRAAIEQEAAESLALADEEMARRREELRIHREEQLEEQRRQLNEHQESLRREAELTRARYAEEMERRRLDMAREHEELLASQMDAKRRQEEELARQREEIRQNNENDMKKQREDVRRHAEEVARHTAELARRNEETRLEQEALDEMRRRAREDEDGERRRLEAEIAKHKEEMRLEAEQVKMDLETLQKEREKIAKKEDAERAAREATRLENELDVAAKTLRAEQEEELRRTFEVAAKAQIEAELDKRVATELQAERSRVAAEAFASEAKVREFEEKQKAAEEQAAANKEGQKVSIELTAAERRAKDINKTRDYSVGDKVEALYTPVGAAPHVKVYIPGEVAYCNPDGSLDVILSDGRMRPEVPLSEINFVERPGAPIGSSPVVNPLAGGELTDDSSTGGSSVEARLFGKPEEGSHGRIDPISSKHLLDQTQSFGKKFGEATPGGEKRQQSAAKADIPSMREATLDDMLVVKMEAVEGATAIADEVEKSVLAASDTVKPPGGDQNGYGKDVGGIIGGKRVVDGMQHAGVSKKRGSLDDILAVKWGKATKGSTNVILQEGDTVEALDSPGGGQSAAFALGIISHIHRDGCVDITLEDGKKLLRQQAKGVRSVRKGNSLYPVAGSSDFAVGDRVEARYGKDLKFQPGVVTSTEDGVSVNFDAGWHGASIPLKHIRWTKGLGSSSSSGHGGEARILSPTPGARMRSTGCILDLDVGSLGGNTSNMGDQVQVRDRIPGVALPNTCNGVIRAVHPMGTYLVGFENGSTRDHVSADSLTDFDWTRQGSAAYHRAAGSDTSAKTGVPGNSPPKRRAFFTDGSGLEGDGKNWDEEGGGHGPSEQTKANSLSKLRGALPGRLGSSIIFPENNLEHTWNIKAVGPKIVRRKTHAGLVDSGEQRLDSTMMHFRPQDFMDLDTAAQAILTPNNAGMFRPRALAGGKTKAGKLSSNIRKDNYKPESGKESVINGDGKLLKNPTDAKPASSGNAPKRRMTFGGLRSDKRGEIYKSQRRPSFMATLGNRAVKVAEAATKATRRLSITGNNGRGFELVAIGDLKTSKNDAAPVSGGDNEESEEHSENETHFYNRSRHVFEPQNTESAPSAYWIRVCGIINLICMAFYLWWRFTRSLIGVKHIIWAFTFLAAECIMAIGMIVGHSSRSFPVHREKVFMDDLTDLDDTMGQLKAAVLIPTCGEKTVVMLKALFGNLQLRLWRSRNPRRDTLRIVVLDEKRREEIQKLVSLVYTLSEVVLDKTVREILMREGVAPISAKGFYDHFANGEHAQRVYDDINFIRGVEIVGEIDKLIAANDDSINRAVFSFNPQEEPLIGEAAVIAINDVRHELYPEFLQRTLPYFFTFDQIRRCYKWSNIAFIQTPQRFHDRDDWNDPDPLGNQAATQFDIVNSGRDGAGGALSCGQGSIWRVQVLREGIRPDGSKFTKKGPDADKVGQQGGLGFRSEVLIEDTHTSIDLFRQGWKSVYVNFPKEILACCTLPPDTVKWRWKQVLRWHQGAVQLAMWKGWKYAFMGETWGTFFQKVFAFDAVSYFLQAFAGEVLLIFPIVYGFTNSAPFNTWNIEFALYFFPFIITGVLPTVAALGWQKTSSSKVMRDEQIWFATSFVQIYAVLHAVWSTITRKDPSNAWNCKCPVWPLYAHFIATVVAVCYNTADWVKRSFEEPWVWVSCIGSAMFALHSLWPVVSFGLGVTMPPAFYTRVFGMLVVMTLVSLWLLGEGGAQR